MIRATNHSSFPKVGESPLDQQVRDALRRHESGRATRDEVDEVIDEATTLGVAEQARAFIDLVTDGMLRWEGPLSHLTGAFDGLEAGRLRRWFDSNTYDRQLIVTGEVKRARSLTRRDYDVAKGVALDRPVKCVLPGPVTVARLALDRHYGDREKLATAVAQVLAEEFADLASAGATSFQLDEPILCRHPEDLELVASTASTVFAAVGDGATTILSTFFGDLSACADRLGELPGTHLGLEATAGSGNLALLDRLPDGRGVYLGVFDARTTVIEDAADVAARLEPYREGLQQRDVLVGPDAGLELLPRDAAFDKLLHARYLVEKLGQEWSWA
ncbi:MAG: hypothetical protein GY716_00105 [bacterium]|nr:hypothetical protein [bacterium]